MFAVIITVAVIAFAFLGMSVLFAVIVPRMIRTADRREYSARYAGFVGTAPALPRR